MDNYFKDRKLSGLEDESFDETLADFNICSRMLTLTELQRSEFFVHMLRGAPRSHFSNKGSPDMPFK